MKLELVYDQMALLLWFTGTLAVGLIVGELAMPRALRPLLSHITGSDPALTMACLLCAAGLCAGSFSLR